MAIAEGKQKAPERAIVPTRSRLKSWRQQYPQRRRGCRGRYVRILDLFGIDAEEFFVLLIIGIFVLGPERIPE